MNDMVLDTAVAQVVMRAKQIERALHDNGPWTIEWASHVAPASRLIYPDRIVFLGHFGERCHLVVPDPTMVLKCRGEVVNTREIVFPGDGAFNVEWAMTVEVIESTARV